MMKKILGATLSAAMTVGLMTAGVTGTTVFAEDNTADTKEADDKLLDGTDMKIGCVFADLGNTSYVAMGKAMEAEAKDHGAEFILKDTGNDSSTLVDVIENFISSGCNVIIEQNSDPGVTETVNQEAILLNASSYDFILERVKGIKAALEEKDPNCEIVIESDAVTTTDGLEAAENFLQAYPELNGVVGINDSVVLGAYEAFKAADRIGDDVGLFACDGSLEGLEAVAEGSIHRGTVSLHLNDVGKQMIDDGITLVNGGTLESTTNYFPLEAVTKDNVQDFIDELN